MPLQSAKLALYARRALFMVRHVLTNPRRIGNLLRYRRGAAGRPLHPDYVPYRLDVEPTTHCNFRCSMCHVSDPGWVGNHMTLDDFQALVDRNPEVFKIKLQGMGEPFINKAFLDMATYAARHGIYVTTTTNGSALTDKVVERLTEDGAVREIIVSLDGATKETFESIRRGSDFDKVVSNAGHLIARNRAQPAHRRAFIAAWTVIQSGNIDEARDILALASRLGFDRLTFQVTISDWGKEGWVGNKDKQVVLDEAAAQQLRQQAAAAGMWFEIYRDNQLAPGTPCPWPFESLYVGAAMDAVPCCSVADPGVANIGSLKATSIAELWRNPANVALRQAHRDGTIPEYCRQCYRQ